MKNQTLRSIALLAMLCLLAVGLASASAVPTPKLSGMTSQSQNAPLSATTFIPFPSAGDAYCSATNGCGTIPSGGQTDFLWTAGDYVVSSSFTLPNAPIVGLSANWTFMDFLGGATETWYLFINNTPVAFFTAPDDAYNGDIFNLVGSVSFPQGTVPMAGSYTVSLVLQNSVLLGGGSVAFLDGGVTGITTVPEPGSLALLGSGMVGLAGLLRRKLF